MTAMGEALWSLYRQQKAKGLRAAMRQTLQKMEKAGLTDSAWYNAMGEIALEEKNANLALRFFQQANQKGELPEYRLNQGHAHYALGDYIEAERHYRAVLEAHGDDVHALVNRANCLIRLNRLEDAWDLCELGLQKTMAKPAFWNTQGQIAYLRGNYPEALRLFKRAYAEAPDYTDALFNQANVEANLGDREQAIAHFAQCGRKDENFESAFYNLALLQLDSGRLSEAQTAIHRALALNANSPDNVHVQARIHYATGELKLAREAFRKALRQQEDHVPSLLGLARVLAQESQADEATSLLKRILAVPALMREDRKAALSVLLDLGHYSLVLTHCERLPESESAEFGLMHTVALWKTGRIREAIVRMEAVLTEAGESPSALILLGMMLREHGALHLAEPRLRRALELSPGDTRAACELALVLLSQDKANDAVEHLLEALRENPRQPDLLYNLACAQSRAGNLDDAMSTLQSALENGFSDFERLGHDSDMQSLRQLKAFAQIVGEPG